jgi:hypothetical protein
MSIQTNEAFRGVARVLAGALGLALVVVAWRAIPASTAQLGIPAAAAHKWSVELIFGYTVGLVPLTAALLLAWYALAGHLAAERRRMKVTLVAALVVCAAVAGPAFVIGTIWAFTNDSNLGPIVGGVMAVFVAPTALFVGAMAGFVGSRFFGRRFVGE